MKNLVFISLFLLNGMVLAGGSEGTVTTPLVTSGDVFIFSSGSHAGKPACATNTLGTWAVSLNSEYGRGIMALALSAHAQGKRLHVQGKNNCDDWVDRETVNYAFIVD